MFGPGRTRLDPATAPVAPPTAEELEHSYQRARSMLTVRDDRFEAPLLRKPLATDAGGAGHFGEDMWGNDVYASTEAPGFQVLLQWVSEARFAASGGSTMEQQP